MSKYIDAGELIKKIINTPSKVARTVKTAGMLTKLADRQSEILDMIDEMPAADVEPMRKWMKASEKKPVFPCITIDGYGNYPKIATGIYGITKENGETLYFTDDLIREKAFMFDGEWAQPLLDKPNNIAYWMPLPETPKMDGGSE